MGGSPGDLVKVDQRLVGVECPREQAEQLTQEGGARAPGCGQKDLPLGDGPRQLEAMSLLPVETASGKAASNAQALEGLLWKMKIRSVNIAREGSSTRGWDQTA